MAEEVHAEPITLRIYVRGVVLESSRSDVGGPMTATIELRHVLAIGGSPSGFLGRGGPWRITIEPVEDSEVEWV